MTKLRNVLAPILVLCALGATPSKASTISVPPATVGSFPDAPHADAPIEWWYANTHITTAKGRHLAIVAAFFRFGTQAQELSLGMPPASPGHYLIYAVTDLDRKTQVSYSYADPAMARGLKQLLLLSGGADQNSFAMLRALLHGKLPAPHRMVTGPVAIEYQPLSVRYGHAGSFAAISGRENAYRLVLGAGRDAVDLDFSSEKPVMPVGGTGETGLVKPTDMYYYSLTRCRVSGSADGDSVASAEGWIDHQWGSSWTTRTNGWDWWGMQLDNGTDILVFQQRDLATGKNFFPLATFMGKAGNLSVTHNIVFRPLPGSWWRSPRTGARYPLAWDITFPDQDLNLRVTADVRGQEIPVLSPGGDIWEGSCTVVGIASEKSPAHASGARHEHGVFVRGDSYMELVGYGRRTISTGDRSRVKRPR